MYLQVNRVVFNNPITQIFYSILPIFYSIFIHNFSFLPWPGKYLVEGEIPACIISESSVEYLFQSKISSS